MSTELLIQIHHSVSNPTPVPPPSTIPTTTIKQSGVGADMPVDDEEAGKVIKIDRKLHENSTDSSVSNEPKQVESLIGVQHGYREINANRGVQNHESTVVPAIPSNENETKEIKSSIVIIDDKQEETAPIKELELQVEAERQGFEDKHKLIMVTASQNESLNIEFKPVIKLNTDEKLEAGVTDNVPGSMVQKAESAPRLKDADEKANIVGDRGPKAETSQPMKNSNPETLPAPGSNNELHPTVSDLRAEHEREEAKPSPVADSKDQNNTEITIAKQTIDLPKTATNPISVKEILKNMNGVFPVDIALEEALPPGYKFVSAHHHGLSSWTVTGKVLALDEDGVQENLFIKIAYGDHGFIMLQGEHESAKEIYRLMPGLIPKPIAFGQYKSKEPAQATFYLSEFVDMDPGQLDPGQLAVSLAGLHKNSVSPNGKFGFHVVTCDGMMPHTVEWEDSWAVFFAKLLKGVCDLDTRMNGEWPEFTRARDQVINHVVPRLLGNLTHNGEPIKPCLIHGDFWEPNLGTNLATKEFVMFDVGSYYAHNEMDLSNWKADFGSVLRRPVYWDAYKDEYPRAKPEDEFEDRNRLYRLKGCINYSAGHSGSNIRKTAYNSMCYLCEKYAPIDGIDKYDPQLDPLVTGEKLVPEFITQ